MDVKLLSTAGWRPPKKQMMFLPKVSSCLRLPLRNPSPTPTSSNRDPTPQAIPNIVRNDRSLCAQRVRMVWTKVSSSVRMAVPHNESFSWTAGSGKGYRNLVLPERGAPTNYGGHAFPELGALIRTFDVGIPPSSRQL